MGGRYWRAPICPSLDKPRLFRLGRACDPLYNVVATPGQPIARLRCCGFRKREFCFFCSGVLFGVACLMKQPGAIFGLFGFCLLLGKAVKEKGQWRAYCERIALYVMGGAAPLALTALLLWQAGVSKRFWFWAIVYAKIHATEYPWAAAGWPQLLSFVETVPFAADGWLSIVAGLGFVSLIRARVDKGRKL